MGQGKVSVPDGEDGRVSALVLCVMRNRKEQEADYLDT